MNDNLNDRVGLETTRICARAQRAGKYSETTEKDCQMVGQFTKGQVLTMGREIPCVLKVPPTARELFYQCLIRCDADGRIRSFSACARAAGIIQRNTSRALKALIDIGLVYKIPQGGGGFNLEKLTALYQMTLELDGGHQIDVPSPIKLMSPPHQIDVPYKSLKKKKDTRVTREGSFFDDTRSRSSWRYRNTRQSQEWVEEEVTPIRPMMNTSMDFV